MKSRQAAEIMLSHAAKEDKDQVQELWQLYHAHAMDVIRVRFQPGSDCERRIHIGYMPALKKELGVWLLAVTRQAGIDWLSPKAADVFFEQLFPGAMTIAQFGNHDGIYP